jgi:phosphoribosylanthranilate isomerase
VRPVRRDLAGKHNKVCHDTRTVDIINKAAKADVTIVGAIMAKDTQRRHTKTSVREGQDRRETTKSTQHTGENEEQDSM